MSAIYDPIAFDIARLVACEERGLKPETAAYLIRQSLREITISNAKEYKMAVAGCGEAEGKS